MEDLETIVIVFENCDFITIDRKHIYNFYISDITETISLALNALIVDKYAGTSHLTLKWNEVKNLTTTLEENRTLEDRINSKDITHYYLHLTDKSTINICLPWGDNDYTNDKEEHTINNDLFTIIHYK